MGKLGEVKVTSGGKVVSAEVVSITTGVARCRQIGSASIETRALPLRQLQRAIDYPSKDPRGRQLVRELIAREREAGVEFMVRMGGPQRCHLRCTVAALRRYAPDLVPTNTQKIRAEILRFVEEEREATRELVANEVARQIGRRVTR